MISFSEYNNFTLKTINGWLKLQLTGNGEKVKSITFKGNNGEQVAGDVYINSADASITLASDSGSSDDDGETGGAGGGLVFEDSILTEVVLNCGEGVALGAEATSFYIALPPQTFSNGFTVTVTTTDGEEMTKLTDKEVVIERNHIQPMAALKYHCTTPENNEIWYTNGSTTTATEPDATNGFGANILSNTYDADKECWVITFDGDVTKIGDDAFIDRGSLTSVTIPNSVTSLGNFAFYGCSNLKSITLSDNLTTIGEYAFDSCSSLTSITIPEGVTKIESWAFSACTSLTNVYCKPTTPPTGDNYMFRNNASGRKIYVPVGSGDAYKAAAWWKDYADYIEEKEL